MKPGLVFALGLVLASAAGAGAEPLVVGAFSSAEPGTSPPAGWEPVAFRGIDIHTGYTMVEEEGRVVVRADSTASASALMRSVRIDPKTHPVVEWRWRISNVLEKGDVSRRSGDDYPARLYVTFAYDPERVGWLERAGFESLRLLYGEYPPRGALNYIWASKAPVGAVVPNPYTDRNRMVVLQSGSARVGEWVTERRNVAEDFRSAFGEEPPVISGVAIMTDTDDTGESAVAWFGDIVFQAARD